MAVADKKQIALRLNTPFCPVKCPYCTKTTLPAGDLWVRRAYIEALSREIESAAADFRDCTVAAVWVGEGVAGHMFDEELGDLLRSLFRLFDMEADAEITCTAHPGMVSVETLNACRKGHVTRLAIEFDTSNLREHAALGRFLDPSAMDTTSMVLGKAAREALSLEFSIAVGIPGQTSASLHRSIDQAIAYGASQVTLRLIDGIGDDRKSALGETNSGLLDIPDGRRLASPGEQRYLFDEQRAELLGFATAYLTMCGFEQYLPLLFAQPGAECRYYELDARGCDVLGFGLGAQTRFAGASAVNTSDLDTYLAYSAVPEKCIVQVARPAGGLEESLSA